MTQNKDGYSTVTTPEGKEIRVKTKIKNRTKYHTMTLEDAEVIVDDLLRDLASRGMIGEIWFAQVRQTEKEEIRTTWAQNIRRRVNKMNRTARKKETV